MKPWTVYPTDDDSPPRVEVNDVGGDLLVVGGVHGDEPCGYNGIVRFYRRYRDDLERPITFLLANPLACQRKVRYIDTDLNRAFDTSVEDEPTQHEDFIAGYLKTVLKNFELVISLHATQSTDEPFALFGTPIKKNALQLLTHLSVTKAIQIPSARKRGSFLWSPSVIELECGFQWSDKAVENAVRFIREAVSFVGGLPQETPKHPIEVFKLEGAIEKPHPVDELQVTNFKPVLPGEIVSTVGSNIQYAKEMFIPILVSKDGYENILGYRGTRLGQLQGASFYQSPTDESLIEYIGW